MIRFIRIGALFISTILFLISLSQSCFSTTEDKSESWQGLLIFIFGFLGFAFSPAGFSWFANIALFISWWQLYKNHKTSFASSGVATILAISFMFFGGVMANESGDYTKITGYDAGYWLWMSSCAIMFICNLIFYFLNEKSFQDASVI